MYSTAYFEKMPIYSSNMTCRSFWTSGRTWENRILRQIFIVWFLKNPQVFLEIGAKFFWQDFLALQCHSVRWNLQTTTKLALVGLLWRVDKAALGLPSSCLHHQLVQGLAGPHLSWFLATFYVFPCAIRVFLPGKSIPLELGLKEEMNCKKLLPQYLICMKQFRMALDNTALLKLYKLF
jgi:hypothetical protein